MDDELELEVDRDRLQAELGLAGFDTGQVTKAFDWLQDLTVNRSTLEDCALATPGSMRLYTAAEQERLDVESRGFLHFLEQAGILDHINRELVVERVMALEADELDIGHLKWIILMVLFNQPDQEQAFYWMEDLVMDELYGSLH